jgi:photosystem II stability/assembly factor-like uncharacterized protein
MNYIKHVLSVLILFTTLIFGQNTWELINPTPTANTLHKSIIDSQSNTWIFGENSTILKSQDNFETWEQIYLPIHAHIFDACVLNNDIWIAGHAGNILHSNDLGESWDEYFFGAGHSFFKVQFMDENHGWFMASDDHILRTKDGGSSWDTVLTNIEYEHNDMVFLDNNTGYILSGSCIINSMWEMGEKVAFGSLIKTSDGGSTWNVIDSGKVKYSSIFFLDDYVGYMSVQDTISGYTLKTYDSGESWDTLGTNPGFDQIVFKDETLGYALAYNYIWETVDGGINWDYLDLNDVILPESGIDHINISGQNVVAVGYAGNIVISDDSGTTWDQKNTSLDFFYAGLKGVTFLDYNRGYIYGKRYRPDPYQDEPILIYTEDRGNNWINKTSPDSNYIYILEVHNDTLWASSENILYMSSDQAQSWTEIYCVEDESGLIRDIDIFSNGRIAFLAGRRVYQSEDRGLTWTHTDEFGVMHLRNLVAANNTTWFLLGHNAATEPNYVTYNAGKNWSSLDRTFTHMQFINDQIGYALENSLYKTTDGGANWILINDMPASWLAQLHFTDENKGILESYSSVCSTEDGGITWERDIGIDGFISYPRGMCVIDENHMWGVNSGGRIYRSYKQESAPDGNVLIPNTAVLQQNYPNPFNPQTTIRYQLTTNNEVDLSIYDISGKKITTLVNDHLNSGNYEIVWNAAGFSSGIYIARLKRRNSILSKKMLLIK